MSVPRPSEQAPAEPAHSLKPKLRGWLHAGTFPARRAAGIVLVALADGTRARVACAVYASRLPALRGERAVPPGHWGPRGGVLRRLDHANIFLIIAGTYTPLTLLLLPEGTARPLLWMVWGGHRRIAFRVFWVGAPRWLYTPVYLAMGWAAVFFLPDFLHDRRRGRPRPGGRRRRLYSAGGIVYGLKRPDPAPRWFGFHEVFHC